MGIYRITVVLLIAGLTWITPVVAQKTKLQQGKDYFMDGSYSKALELFNQTVSQDRSLTPEMLSEAYYYRGLTYVRLYDESYTGEDKEAQKLYIDALLSAYRDYKKSMNYDHGDQWKKIDLEIKNLHHALLREGLASLNEYNDLVFNGKTDPKLLARAGDYLVSAHEIRETYLVCDLLGQVYLDKGQKQEAAGYFTKAEKLYTEKLPEEPDFLMAYVFYRLAALHKPDSIRLAMQDNQRGLILLESEHERFLALKNKLTPVRAQQMEEQYQLALRDLNNLKLDLYLSDSELYVEALHVFEEELAKNPGDIDLLIGYASLLEKSDKDKAILTYQKALQVDPNNAIVLFNLGALYYAKGKALFDTAQNSSDNKQFELLSEGALANFEKARPFFEQVLIEDPSSLETIQALKTIAFILDDQPSYLKYQDMESKLGR
ncbi:MAG: tetratricopeptide repeat protein [Bacteroidales bacterium]|nr:tetratricopeptide repeat protein [Bacteroidales bacterium]